MWYGGGQNDYCSQVRGMAKLLQEEGVSASLTFFFLAVAMTLRHQLTRYHLSIQALFGQSTQNR